MKQLKIVPPAEETFKWDGPGWYLDSGGGLREVHLDHIKSRYFMVLYDLLQLLSCDGRAVYQDERSVYQPDPSGIQMVRKVADPGPKPETIPEVSKPMTLADVPEGEWWDSDILVPYVRYGVVTYYFDGTLHISSDKPSNIKVTRPLGRLVFEDS